MKKIIIFILAISGTLLITGCNKKSNENVEIYHRNDLKVISEYNEYIIALSKELDETNIYSMYKNTNYEDYEKIWDFEIENNHDIENHHITWNENNVYLLGWDNSAYDIDTGKEVYSLSTNLMVLKNNDEGVGNLDRLFGNDGKFIYYEYSHNTDNYYGKVTMDLKSVEVINESDIPTNLNN